METAQEAWARCGPWLEAALRHAGGGHALGDVADLVARGRAHFWPGARCAVVTEFHDQPRLKACNYWLMGGDLKALLEMQPTIEAWAHAQGCARMLGGGPRRGWERVLRPLGYRPQWIIYIKELEP